MNILIAEDEKSLRLALEDELQEVEKLLSLQQWIKFYYYYYYFVLFFVVFLK